MTPSSLAGIIMERSAAFQRYMVAIAGPPGGGKSTLAEQLVRELPINTAALVPMDGFHYDNAVLDQLGLRARKGSPESFDYCGFEALLRRLRNREQDVATPIFDREADLARAGAVMVNREIKFIIAEGNYLLLDEAPWTGLAEYFDLTIFIEVPRDVLRDRLLQRWTQLGYSNERAAQWVASNDMPNVDRVLNHRRRVDLSIPPWAD